jgi:hypothetical protein
MKKGAAATSKSSDAQLEISAKDYQWIDIEVGANDLG